MNQEAGRDLAASVRARLLNRAKAEGSDFNGVLVRYALERLLYRLSRSAHADRFLLKGAMLFTLWYDMPHRPTRDVDLLGFGASDLESITQTFRDIASVAVEDGIRFDPASVTAEEIRKEAGYAGARVSIAAQLAGARLKTQLGVKISTMSLFDLFSKRQRRIRGDVPDVYAYDALPQPLRVQIIHILTDAFGEDPYGGHQAIDSYKFANDTLCREYGVFELVKRSDSAKASVFNFFLAEESVERALDVVELCFKLVNTYVRTEYKYTNSPEYKCAPDEALSELNARFREHGVGYQFESNELIRIDSEFLHSEAVKPVLSFLRDKNYQGANDEFLRAHEHYRHGRHKECLVEALKSFESTMKTICMKRKWTVQANDTAKNLIAVCFSNGLLPSYLESQLASLRSLLESGVPTVRNKVGGHGQGTAVKSVPAYVAGYGLHLTASSILFLVQAEAATE